MEINDLMIDDWVIFHDSGYASDGTVWEEDRICQIDCIDVDVRVKWVEEDGYREDWPHISVLDLSPIPLSPDILVKNGFHEDHGAYYCGDEETYNIIYWPEDSYLEVQNLVNEEGCDVHCYAVHQLQNCLRLLSIEKEIIL